jgi:hypothetical protein
MAAIYGMMAMMPALFASAGYVLVSSRGTAEGNGSRIRKPSSAASASAGAPPVPA